MKVIDNNNYSSIIYTLIVDSILLNFMLAFNSVADIAKTRGCLSLGQSSNRCIICRIG